MRAIATRPLVLLLALACANDATAPKPQPTVMMLNRSTFQIYLSWRDSAGILFTDTLHAGAMLCAGFPAHQDSAYWTASDGSQVLGGNYEHAGQPPSWNVSYAIVPPNVVYTFQAYPSIACS